MMSTFTRGHILSAVHPEGGLIPSDMLVRISEGAGVSGSRPADYRVVGARSVRDDAERHWDFLRAIWRELRDRLPAAPAAEAPADRTGIAVTQWLEPLLAELGFGRLTAVAAAGIRSDDGGKVFPISHRWHHVPIHLTAWHTTLDKRVAGAGTVPPQSLVQECLNRTESQLWGVLSNGRQLRLLRDSSALATASYIEFDLEAIFDGELFSEFVLLYRLLHVSRFEVAEGVAPSSCWLEKWRVEAIESGTRALDHHREGVQRAITTLGTGFLRHPDNARLRDDLDVDEFHAALLRLAYRLIFLFVAEDREALHPPGATEMARQRYAAYFSSRRLRDRASRRRGTVHTDLYQALRIVLDALGDEHGRPELGLPGLGGLFDDTDADAPLHEMSLSNHYLLEAVGHLDRVRDDSGRWRRVDYRNMDSEELGSIYESLLEQVPKHRATDRSFELVDRLGNDRKKTGSYYTPSSLIERLLDSTLDPVIDDAHKLGEQKASAAGESDPTGTIAEELLSLTVCDPACGSGHFLVAAARRIAKRVAAVREKNPEPTLDAVRHALHEVVAQCVYGVDLNPIAVELAKVSLWLEALEPGRPLGFLDAHVKHGNGLIGATPALIRGGIPDKAFKPVEGDERAFAAFLERQNREEHKGQGSLFNLDAEPKVANTAFATRLRRIAETPADTLGDVHRQAAAYRDLQAAAAYVHAKRVADAWCAAFMWHKTKDAPPTVTEGVFRALQDPDAAAASQATHDEIARLRDQYRFFHWQLEFPNVFRVPEGGTGPGVDPATGWAGGFSCVLGNPPWDKVDFEDKKYFSVVEPSIAETPGTARRTRIAEWIADNVEAGERYRAARRKVKSTFHFKSKSGSFPLCQRGLSAKGVNSLFVDHLFAERFSGLIAPEGRFGCIVQTSIATGAGAQHLFWDFSRRSVLKSLYDFENRKRIFQAVDATYNFCLLSAVGRNLYEPAARFAFFLLSTSDLDDANRTFTLSPEEIGLISPNTGTIPVFRTRRDADLTAMIYRRIPVLWNETKKEGNTWGITFKNLFNIKDDSDLFRTQQQLEEEGWELDGDVFVRHGERMLRLYEGKMAYHFDHRWRHFTGTGDGDRRPLSAIEKGDPTVSAIPRYWVADEGFIPTTRNNRRIEVPGVALRLQEVAWQRAWLYGWRDVTKAVNERTAVAVILPRAAAGHTYPLMFTDQLPKLVLALAAAQSALVFDYLSRQKIGGRHMAIMTWKQLPVPKPATMERHTQFITPRVIELVYTTYDMAGLARDLGDDGGPFRWDEDRRAQIRAELDAYFFHLYGISRDDTDYILETFQSDSGGGLKHNEIAKYGRYRTKELVLAEYDRMAPADVDLTTPLIDGENYTSTLMPPPGHGPRRPAASVHEGV